MHMERRTLASKMKLDVEGQNRQEAETGTNTMFIFWNCTASLWNVLLDSSVMGTTVGRLRESCVTIVGSRILSNAEQSPFVIVGGGSAVGSWISVIDSVHESSDCLVLLPLVWEMSSELDESGSVLVSGSGMEVSNVHLIAGSGPLFGRSEQATRETRRDDSRVETRLIGSRIVNTTSEVGVRSGVEGIGEGLVGCSVSSSTNHLCGTAIGGMDDGGSLLSLNTSFTCCHTPSWTNADPNIRQNQYLKGRTAISSITSPHVFTLCTFKQCSAQKNGGAIATETNKIILQIDQCSFHTCSCIISTGWGGAISVCPPDGGQATLSVSSSSFFGCTAPFGGSLYLFRVHDLSVSECVFLDSKSSFFGGAIAIANTSFGASAGITNTLFQNCRETTTGTSFGGAAFHIHNCPSHKLSYVQFRLCVAAGGRGHDVFLQGSPFTSSSYSTCDSTSSNKHRVSSGSSDNSSLLKDTEFEATIESLAWTETGDDTVTFILTLDKAVSGTMMVLVSNLEGTRQEVNGMAPKIGRVLFSFVSSAVGTCSSSVGESELLQLPLSDYKILAASISNHKATTPSDLLAAPAIPTIIRASCDLDESGTEVDVTFSGMVIPEGPCTLTLNDSSTLEVTFSDESGTSVGSVTKGVSGKDGEWSEKTEYVLTGIVSLVSPATSIEIASDVGFRIPAAARLSKVSVSGFVDPRKTSVQLSFESLKLEANKNYILKLKQTESSEDAITRELETDGNGDVLDVTESLYPFMTEAEERRKQLKFGKSYEVLSLTASGRTRSVLISSFVITMPDEPMRITSSSCSLGGDQQKSALVILKGVKLGGGMEFNVTVQKMIGLAASGEDIVLSGRLSGSSSSTEHTHSVDIFGVSNAPLSFDTKYLITKFVAKDYVSAVDAFVTFFVPAEPARITGARSWLNGKKDELIVELSGSALSSSSDLSVVMTGTSHSVSSSGGLFNVSSTKCFVKFAIGLNEDESNVVFGGHYDLLSVGSGSSSVIVTPGLVVDVDHPPRIVSIVVPEEVTTSTFDLSVSGSHLPSGKTYTVTLTTDHTFEISFNSASAGASTVTIGGSGQVQYDTSYTIQSIILSESEKEDEHILFSELTFKTPRGPTLSSISCDFDPSDPDSVKVSLSTERMPIADFTIVVETIEPDDSPSETVELTITSSAISSGFVVVKVYKQTGTLKYGTNYLVTQMWSGSVVVVLANRLFSTPPEPIRITSASCSLGGDQEKSALVSLKGVKLGGGMEFNVTVQKMIGLAASGEDIVLSGRLSGSSSSTEHILSVEIFGISNTPLSFDTKYLITKFVVKDSVSTVDADATFFVPAEPARIVDVKRRQLNPDRTRMLVLLKGRALDSRTGLVCLMKGNTLLEWLSDVAVVNNTHCTLEFTVGGTENSTHMKYGEEYTLQGSWTASSGFHVESGIKVRVPFPPKITDLKFTFSNTLHTGCFVDLTGTDLIVGNSLNVTLNESLSFITTITSETKARSSEQLIGWTTSLNHNTQYTITSIEAMNEDDGTTFCDPLITKAPGSLPDDVVIYVDSDSSSDSSLFCGDRTRPCSTIEDGWKIVEGVGISTFSISILHNTTQTEQVKILSHHEVVIESKPSTKPELFVSPSLSSSELDGEGMVDVCGGRLRVHDVDVVLSDSASVIFIRMVGGYLTIETCSLVGPKGTPAINNIESGHDLCEWDTGALILVDSTTTITSTRLTHLSSGAINMKKGNLTISSSSIDSNTPHSSSFPSLRHNIRCSEGGEIEVGSLNGGDGSSETHPHLWLSHDDCLLSGNDVKVNAPFFVPTLSSSSTSKLNKTEKAFILTINGTTLIPCSLMLEVFEKKKDGTEGQSKQFPLALDTTMSFNDSTIELSLPLSSLSSFDASLEWDGRLLFGKDEKSSSFTIQLSAADRRSQAVRENMKWWIPLLVSLICLLIFIVVIVFVCWRRRRQTKQNTLLAQPQELAPIDEKMEIEYEDSVTMEVSKIVESTKMENRESIASKEIDSDLAECLNCGEGFVTSFVPKKATLYELLHRERKTLANRRQCEIQLSRGLDQMARMAEFSKMLQHVTSHRILIGKDGSLNVNLEKPEGTGSGLSKMGAMFENSYQKLRKWLSNLE
ncbi:hypothetical protein BLNAU_21284 [Blattamonas nauphoetae]|uniref:Uncharacterized protein n=1 Tax=Blattamonas nauphoetae TaxID=2049346 RepID=A0ABQ9WWB5_9EUKA|nr:hypothetical protein BLNAU_21284 [Blattamonas nauphoetae]